MKNGAQTLRRPKYIRPASVFSAIGPKARADLLQCGSERHYLSGEMLFTQREEHKMAFFIYRGLIRTYYFSTCGREITMAFWTADDLVGGPDFFNPTPHIWSAVAIKTTSALAVPVSKFGKLSQTHPDLSGYINRLLTFKLAWLSNLVQIMGTGSVADRLAYTLLQLGELYGIRTRQGITITESFSHEDLSAMIGASRQWTSISLIALKRAGVIAIDKRRITLIDLGALEGVYKNNV